MADCKQGLSETGVDDICFPLTSSKFNYFFLSKKPGVVQNIAFHIKPLLLTNLV